MRSIIRSTRQLSALRASLRRDVTIMGDDELFIDDFITAVNEVTAAALSSCGLAEASIDVRWIRRTYPRAELWAEIRHTEATPTSLLGEGIIARVLEFTTERVDVQERIGGSVITVRCRI